VQDAEDELRERYVVLKDLLHARYGDDNTKNSYGITGGMPRARGQLESKVDKLIENHGTQVVAGDPLVLPDIMIANLQNLRDAMHAAQVVSETEFKEAKDSTKEALAIFEADSYMLRVLYKWCVAIWGKDSTNLLLLGFIQVYSQTGGGEVPAAPEGFEFDWLEPVLQFSWYAVEGATSYQIAFSEDGGEVWEELYTGADSDFEYEPPEGLRQYRIRARNADGYGDWSEVVEFEIEGAPPMGEWPAELTGLYANYSDFPSPIIIVGHDGQTGANTYRLKRVKVLITDPDPTNADMPEENYVEGLNEDPFADTDIASGDKCAYWACGVDVADVEGEWTGPVVGEYPA